MSRWQIVMKPKAAPDAPGCYVIKFGTGEMYVGSTTLSLRRRLWTYLPWMKELGLEWIKWKKTAKLGDWLMDEYRLIKRLDPALNKKSANGKGVALHNNPTSARLMEDAQTRHLTTNGFVQHLKKLIKEGKRDELNRLVGNKSKYVK